MSRPKDNPARNEAYRRKVAALPCAMCGIEGSSQCAHGPTLGRGIKCSDYDTFPLCADGPGRVGCHRLYDNYIDTAEVRREQAKAWIAQTREKLGLG